MSTNLENLRAAAEDDGLDGLMSLSDEFLNQSYKDALQLAIDEVDNEPFNGDLQNVPEETADWIRDLVIPIGFQVAFGGGFPDAEKLAETAMLIAAAAYSRGFNDAKAAE